MELVRGWSILEIPCRSQPIGICIIYFDRIRLSQNFERFDSFGVHRRYKNNRRHCTAATHGGYVKIEKARHSLKYHNIPHPAANESTAEEWIRHLLFLKFLSDALKDLFRRLTCSSHTCNFITLFEVASITR